MNDSEESLRLETFIPYRLMTAAEKVSLGFSKIYKEKYGLSRPEWRVLASLAQLGPTTATDIGGHSSMHKTKVSRAVRELEQRKWLMRVTNDKDRRFEQLQLTKTGRANFSKLAALAHAYQANLLQTLGKQSGLRLMELLDQLDAID